MKQHLQPVLNHGPVQLAVVTILGVGVAFGLYLAMVTVATLIP